MVNGVRRGKGKEIDAAHMALARFGVYCLPAVFVRARAPVQASERSISYRKPWIRPWPLAGLSVDLTKPNEQRAQGKPQASLSKGQKATEGPRRRRSTKDYILTSTAVLP